MRQTWKQDPLTDIVFTYTITTAFTNDYAQGLCNRSASAMELLADHNGIPSINFGIRVAQLLKESKLHFKFEGSTAKVYDLIGPDGGQVVITVDGKKGAKPVPRFDSYCTYHRIATLGAVQDTDMTQVHEVAIEIHPEQPDRQSVAFRLKDPAKELKEPKFQGTRVWMSQLMLLGDVVE